MKVQHSDLCRGLQRSVSRARGVLWLHRISGGQHLHVSVAPPLSAGGCRGSRPGRLWACRSGVRRPRLSSRLCRQDARFPSLSPGRREDGRWSFSLCRWGKEVETPVCKRGPPSPAFLQPVTFSLTNVCWTKLILRTHRIAPRPRGHSSWGSLENSAPVFLLQWGVIETMFKAKKGRCVEPEYLCCISGCRCGALRLPGHSSCVQGGHSCQPLPLRTVTLAVQRFYFVA